MTLLWKWKSGFLVADCLTIEFRLLRFWFPKLDWRFVLSRTCFLADVKLSGIFFSSSSAHNTASTYRKMSTRCWHRTSLRKFLFSDFSIIRKETKIEIAQRPCGPHGRECFNACIDVRRYVSGLKRRIKERRQSLSEGSSFSFASRLFFPRLRSHKRRRNEFILHENSPFLLPRRNTKFSSPWKEFLNGLIRFPDWK